MYKRSNIVLVICALKSDWFKVIEREKTMNITVYCGANFGNKEIYKEAAASLAKWIGENHHNLVYGGSRVGLMGIVSNGVLDAGGRVTGIIPTFLVDREQANHRITELIEVETMSERKKKMADLGEVFIALPGGAGTLEEITEVVSWARLGRHKSPCIFFNANNYYRHIESAYDLMVEEGFLSEEDRNLTLFSDSFEAIEEFIKNYAK